MLGMSVLSQWPDGRHSKVLTFLKSSKGQEIEQEIPWSLTFKNTLKITCSKSDLSSSTNRSQKALRYLEAISLGWGRTGHALPSTRSTIPRLDLCLALSWCWQHEPLGGQWRSQHGPQLLQGPSSPPAGPRGMGSWAMCESIMAAAAAHVLCGSTLSSEQKSAGLADQGEYRSHFNKFRNLVFPHNFHLCGSSWNRRKVWKIKPALLMP